MIKKEDIYVIVDTPKKEKKLIKVLEMFGENVSNYPDHKNEIHNGKNVLGWRYGFSDGSWQGVNTKFVGHKGKVFTEVSIKELRNILTYHHQVTQLNIGYEAGKGYHRENELWPKTSSDINFELTPDDYKDNTWYKSNTGNIFLLEKGRKNYGFSPNYLDNIEWFKNFRENGFHTKGQWTEATEQEVLEAFTKEANKRFKVGDRIVSPDGTDYGYKVDNTNYKFIRRQMNENIFGFLIDTVVTTNLFHNGVWATVLDPFAELKEAYKNGTIIQVNYDDDRGWLDTVAPKWNTIYEYRIKPEEKNKKKEKPKIGDVCKFWDVNEESFCIGFLTEIDHFAHYVYQVGHVARYRNAQPITKQEIIDLLALN